MKRIVVVLLSLFACGCSAAPAPAIADAPDASTEADSSTQQGDDAGAQSDAGPPRACSETSPRSVPLAMAVLPDDAEAPYVDAIASATTSVHVMVYQMGYGGILDAITAKAKAGLDVKVILDGVTQQSVNGKYKTALEAAGAQVHWSDPQFPYMHAKIIVVDGTRAVVSTGNFLKSILLEERNFAADDRDPQDVHDLSALFDADWTMMPPDLSCTRLVVSPVNSKDRIVALIEGAQTSVLVESMELADTAVRDALAKRRAAGLDVRVLLAPSWISTNTAAADAMKASNVEARYLATPMIHVKAIVVDGARAYMGSENLSSTSLTKNREVGLVVTDAPAVARMKQTMETDFAGATPF